VEQRIVASLEESLFLQLTGSPLHNGGASEGVSVSLIEPLLVERPRAGQTPGRKPFWRPFIAPIAPRFASASRGQGPRAFEDLLP
jgi:hypothetical protein